MEINKHFKNVKQAIKKELNPNIFTYSKYRLSPYSACEHGCIYCDGRAEKYFVQGKFDQDIVIRENLPSLINEEIPKLREKGIISIGSGITDVYQPIEADEFLMGEILKNLSEHNFPVSLLTKSSLIERDLEYISLINKKSRFILYLTITGLNEKIINDFEPNASPVSQRLDLIEKFKKAGCIVGILYMPVLPYLTDDENEIANLVKEVKKRGADFLIPGCLTLRPGKQKNFFMKFLGAKYNHLTASYEKLYSNEASSGIPHKGYTDMLYKRFYSILKKENLPFLMPHGLYKGLMQNYDEIYILLNQMVDIYGYSGIDTSRLKIALAKYVNWLEIEKKKFNRKRSLNSSYISDLLDFKFKTGEFSKIIENEKLGDFLFDAVIESKVFNPASFKLE